MALGAEAARRRPFPAAPGNGEVAGGASAAPVFLVAACGDRLPAMVDPVIWGDEKRMKRELLAWAKAVATMAATKNTSSSSTTTAPPSTRRR